MQRYRRSVIVAFLATVLLGQAEPHRAGADAASPVIPLPDTDRAQLDRLLGKGVIGEALPSAPLADIDAYLPPKGSVMSLRVVTSDMKATEETHKIENTVDAAFAPGWHYTIEGITEPYFQKDSTGNICTIAEKDLDKAVLSRFTPGDPLIIPGLKPGESIKQGRGVRSVELEAGVAFRLARCHLHLRGNLSGDSAEWDL
jgi:hypothetical protein